MSSDDFYDEPFDEGTLTKLQIFELYAREWLPVFLAKPEPLRPEIHLFDFFAGKGRDVKGVPGSPLRLLDQLGKVTALPAWSRTRICLHLFDASANRIAALRRDIASAPQITGLELEIEALDFDVAFRRSRSILENPRAAKLVLIDQFGVDIVTPEVFRALIEARTCDFLFFLSSWTLHRFRDHPAIKQKITRPLDHYHVHRAALDYYRDLLPSRSPYYLAPFSIKKGSNIYGLIFGSAHPLGMDKFLQVAWNEDEINGEADFDINRDNIQPGQLKLDLKEFQPTKVSAFERELDDLLRDGKLLDERDVIRVCFRHGVTRQHSTKVLGGSRAAGVINLNFRVPDIGRLRDPRPIRKV